MKRMGQLTRAILVAVTVSLGCAKEEPQTTQQAADVQVAEIRRQMESLSAQVQAEFLVDIRDTAEAVYRGLSAEEHEKLNRMVQRYHELEVHLSSKLTLLEHHGEERGVAPSLGDSSWLHAVETPEA